MQEVEVVGVGLGPANLALGLALIEREQQRTDFCSWRFIERNANFAWHSGMLIENARMQVSFLKDLVTQRNPCSPHSFVNYLNTKARLQDFINLGTFYPTRLEFHDYLSWCAESVKHKVDYGAEVVRIKSCVSTSGTVGSLSVVVRDLKCNTEREVIAKSVVVAPGLQPRLPANSRCGPRTWHSSEFLHRLHALDRQEPLHFIVVGAGQSAAEIVEHLLTRFPGASVRAVFSKFAYLPADDSPFVNRLFDPQAVDDFHFAPSAIRERILSDHANTNYGAVNVDLIESLYRTWYAERLSGRNRLQFERFARVSSIVDNGHRAVVELEPLDRGDVRTLTADYVVCATGYESVAADNLFDDDLRALVVRDGDGNPVVDRSYRMVMSEAVRASIFTQTGVEATHGLSATLISNLAVRAGEIAQLLEKRTWQHRDYTALTDRGALNVAD